MGLMGYGYVAPRLTRRIERREAIRQRLHEAHEGVLLLLRQAQPPDSLRVHVGGPLWCRPARRAFARIVGLAARQNGPRVVERQFGFLARERPVCVVVLRDVRISARMSLCL